ncbi:hypothetical protein GBAR_LOCUS9463, partial [Geodia barretti]
MMVVFSCSYRVNASGELYFAHAHRVNVPTHARERRIVMEFQIPLSREDLLRPSGGSQFFVSEPLPARETVSRLEECRSLLDSSVVASIPECFPVFFSLLQNFLSVGVSVRESYWRIGVRGLEGVCHQVGGANFTGMTQTKKTELRNALK